MFDISKCQKIVINQGALYLGPSDEKQSVGYLELKPKNSLTLHNRPAVEKLTQAEGRCDMIVYRGEKAEVITMNKGDKLVIEPTGTYHIHNNPYDRTSLTYWDFDGDITEIIEAIRSKGE